MEQEFLSLYTLNSLIGEVIRHHFDQTCWVKVEISELRENRNGHCYWECIEKEQNGSIIARAKVNCWAGTWGMLSPYFRQQTGMELAPGLKVLIAVRVDFHPLFGYALTVEDIDPSYTLGDMERNKKEILDRLSAEGVFEMNKELTFPYLPQRVAVISSETAAGWGDFADQLTSVFKIEWELFPAKMQGSQTGSSIVEALDLIYQRQEDFDIVVIIRGGGAVADLHSFDTYPLAAAVAQFPLPVLTGIGHQRDNTVVDAVAYLSLKTPTAVAAYLTDCMEKRYHQWADNGQRITLWIDKKVHAEKECIFRLQMILKRVRQTVFTHQKNTIEYASRRIRELVKMQLSLQQHKRENLEIKICSYSPEEILKKGYSLTLSNRRIITDIHTLCPGDELETRLQNGIIKSIVK